MIVSDMVEQVGRATASVGSAIAADLQQAAMVAGMGGTFEVDLQVLYGYYGKLTDLYDEIDTQLARLNASAMPGDFQCGGAGNRIGGAARAAESTNLAAGTLGMQGALLAIQQQIGAHLAGLKANYDAYVDADDNGARVLTAAAHPELAGHQTPSDKTAQDARPSGW